MNQNQWLYSVVYPIFMKDFTEQVLNRACYNNNDYLKQISQFKADITAQGLKLIEIPADSLNGRRYYISVIEKDKEGFFLQKNICVFRYVTGVYGGTLVQLKDDNNLNICSKGHIR